MKTQVALVTSDQTTCTSVAGMFADADEVVFIGCYESAAAALETIPTAPPNVLLVDSGLPGLGGIECVARLKELEPKLQVLVLTNSDDNREIVKFLRAGASGCLLKASLATELRQAIAQLTQGGAPMSMPIARRLVAYFHQLPDFTETTPTLAMLPPPVTKPLSEREVQVLDGLARGLEDKTIGSELAISEKTVRTYVKRLLSKLHVHSRAQAVEALSPRLPDRLAAEEESLALVGT
jgi:DNA-binding NarL/FixJ family response regulator